MKCGKFFYICLIVLCLVLGYGQSENLQDVWREYKSFHKHFVYDGSYFRMTDVSIPERFAVNDPEAAAVAEVKIVVYSLLESEQMVDAIRANQKKFPDNEYLLYELVRTLHRCDGVIDPLIPLRYTERLIELNPDNVNYRLIKCKLLLDDLSDNNIGPVLDELKLANECSQYSWPYEQYKQRALEIAEQAKLGRYFLGIISDDHGSYPSLHNINDKLFAYANKAFTDGQKDEGQRIIDALNDLPRLFACTGDHRYMSMMNMGSPFYFGHWTNTQGFELQRIDLTKEQARNNRLQLCVSMLRKTESQSQLRSKDSREKRDKKLRNFSLAMPLILHSGKMFIAFICSAVIILVICLRQGFGEKVKVSSWAVILFLLSCFYFFCVSRIDFVHAFIGRFSFFTCGCQYWGRHVFSFRMPPGWEYFGDEPVAISLTLGVPIIAAVIFWRISVRKPRKGAFWRFWNLRFIRLLVLTTFLGAVSILLQSISYIRYVPMVIFILTAALVANTKVSHDSVFRSVTRYFGNDDEIVELRKKSLRLIVPFMALHWLVFILLVPFVAGFINFENRPFERSPQKIIFPEAEDAYNEILGKFQQEKISSMAMFRYLGVIMHEDLPAVLEKLKEVGFADYFGMPFGSMSGGMLPVKKDNSREKLRHLNDHYLAFVLQSCGRDTVDIITSFMDDPDLDHALVGRARLGDKSTKQKLEAIYLKRLSSKPDRERDYRSREVHTGDVIGALACISEPDDAVKYYLDYISSRNVSDLINEDYLFENIQLLPTKQAREVIKAYLARLGEDQPQTAKTSSRESNRDWRRKLYPLDRIAGLYGDGQIADEILKIQLLMDEKDYDVMDISQHLTVESLPLLKKGLSGKNDKLRAWCVWQLRKLGYDWEKGELDKLLKDEDWYVRTNAGLIICKR